MLSIHRSMRIHSRKQDWELRWDYCRKLCLVVELMPSPTSDVVQEAILMSPPLLPYVVMFRNFLSIEVKPSKWVLGEWASYGFAAALSLCLLAWCLYFTAPSYIQYPRILLAGALAASYMQKEGITTSRPAAFLFGISAFLTLEMAVTGCACGCHVGSVFNTLLLPLKALTHVLWLLGCC